MLHILKKLSACIVILTAAVCAHAQDITKVAVVDTARVYSSYFRDTAPVRNYEAKKADLQKEVDKMTEELKQLQTRKLEYEQRGDSAGALRIQNQITQKSNYLTEYTNAKNIELENLRRSLENSDAFYSRLYETLRRIAENGGYSLILSLQQANGVLWYSSSVDITDQVISALGL